MGIKGSLSLDAHDFLYPLSISITITMTGSQNTDTLNPPRPTGIDLYSRFAVAGAFGCGKIFVSVGQFFLRFILTLFACEKVSLTGL